MSLILIVEDDERLASIMVRALASAGHQSEHAAKGTDAVHAARSGRFDLVLLDIGLPDIGGLQVLDHIRQATPLLPVVLVTADNAPDHIVGGLRAGADDYITKPFRLDELLARVDARLRRARVPDTSLTVAGLTLDLVAHTVSGPRGVIHLSTREFELLEYLMRRPNLVVERERVLRDVWGFGVERSSNVVDVYVRYLRQKGADSIETVHGTGYRLRA